MPICLVLLAVLAACSPDRPNIVLVTVDTLRWDYLGAYGYPEAEISPSFNRLAASGIVFENAVSTAGTTIPSHASMLTGHYAKVHGARSNFHGKYPAVPSVAGELQAAGYSTGAFVSANFLFEVGRLGDGFQFLNDPYQDDSQTIRPQDGDRTISQFASWLDEVDLDDPLFSWIHLWEPHGPHDITEWASKRLGHYDGLLRDGMSLHHIQNRVGEILDSPKDLEAMRTLYAGEVNLADRYLGLIIDHLDDRGLLDNTVIFFTADHGQTLGEDHRHGHGPVHRETVIRVPLVIADFRDRRRLRIATRVGTIDIAPTIADIAGLDSHFDFAGRSIRNPADLADEYPYFTEVALRTSADTHWEKIRNNKSYDPESLGVYFGWMKLVFRQGQYRLFNTATDLKVARPIELADEAVMAEYLVGLIEEFQETGLDLSRDEVSDENIEALKSLGYIQ